METSMETMLLHRQVATAVGSAVTSSQASVGLDRDQPQPREMELCEGAWRKGLPSINGRSLTLRELRPADAASLLELLSADEVTKFISPPPTTVEGFERFIAWAELQRAAGRYACFAVVPNGLDIAVGLFQVRGLDPDFVTAEWGFVLGSAFWGTGIFVEGARLVIDFAFEQIGVNRLEARASVHNGRGNGALQKLGAVHEAVLRRSFTRDGACHDQHLWSILREDWRQAKAVWGPKYH
jgi:[ribosomal protein S5]-alanine N-acetyltransferase